MSQDLSEYEKGIYDALIEKVVEPPAGKNVQLARMLLDGKEVAVVMVAVHNRFNPEKLEGYMAVARILPVDEMDRLQDPDGNEGLVFSPNEVI